MRKVGLIGIGKAADAAFMPVLAQMAGVEVFALHPRRERVEQYGRRWPLAGVATSMDELLAHGIQTAIVSTPGTAHTEFVLPLLEAGIDVLTEKPMSLLLRECDAMVETAARTGRILMVGVNRRFAPVVAQARAHVQNLEVVIAQKNKPSSQYRAFGYDAIHVVDAMRWLCGGEVVSVSATARYEDPMHERSVTAHVAFDNGRTGIVVMHRHSGHWMESIELHGGGRTALVEYPDRLRLTESEEQRLVEMTPRAWGWSQVHDVCGFTAQLQHFFECVDQRRTPISDGADLLKTHILVDRIYREAGLPGLE